MMIPYYLIIA